MGYNNKFCKYGKSKSPFQNKISRKEAKENYIANEAANKINEDSDLLEINAAQDVAGQKYDALSRKERKSLRKT